MKIKCVLMTLLFLFLAFAVQAEDKGVGTNELFKGPVGLQLYSLRDIFSKDVLLGMKLSEDFGFKYVELAGTYGLSTQEMIELLNKHQLVAVAGHWGFDQFKNNPEAVAKEAKELGLKFAGVAWIPHEGEFDEAEARHAADVFNKAGAVLAKEGIQFYYHNHGYEFQPFEDGTLFDLLVQQTDPELVSFQMDVLWTVFPGQDPVAILKKYPNRFSLFHLKDLKKGVEGNLTGGTSVENDVPLGSGQVDYPALLKTAQEIGIQYYFIEDESPTVLEQIPVSLKYLESIQW
ncbi:MAG: sugar phosphate isomerase/epimerase [Planctomycetia bacterium]|nr:sugar phosphate isomerase/epimerase [Planctomycetia bacterium]